MEGSITLQKAAISSALLRQVGRIKGELAWVLTGQIAGALGSLIGVRLMTELLPPSIYGELALGATAATLVGEMLFGPLANGIIRFYTPAKECGDLAGYLNASRRLSILATAIVVLLGFVVIIGVALLSRTKWAGLLIATLFFSVLYGFNNILSGIQNAARQRSIVALHQGVESWTRFLIAAGLVVLLGPVSSIAMSGYALGIAVVLCSQYFFFGVIAREAKNSRREVSWERKILDYSWPFCTWSFFTWAQLSSDRWALGTYSSTKDVGLYAALYQLGNYPITMATLMATQLLAPILFQYAGHGRDEGRNAKANGYSWRISVLILLLTVIGSLAALLLHHQIFRLFVSPKYAPVSYLLPWMLLGSGIYSAGQTVALSLLIQMKTHKLIAAKITTALVGLALNFIGARYYGIRGVVFGGILFSVLHFIWLSVLAEYERRTSLTVSEPSGTTL